MEKVEITVFMQSRVDREWEYLKVKSRFGKETFCDVNAAGTLGLPFLRPLWEVDKSVSPKQPLLHQLGTNHLLGVCGRVQVRTVH